MLSGTEAIVAQPHESLPPLEDPLLRDEYTTSNRKVITVILERTAAAVTAYDIEAARVALEGAATDFRDRSVIGSLCTCGGVSSASRNYGYRTGTVSVLTTVVPDPVVARIRTLTSSPFRSSDVSVTAGSASPTATVCQVAPASSLTWTM